MRESMFFCLLVAAATSIAAASPARVSAQVPEPSSTPRLAVPARGTAVPTAQAPGQPTVTPAAETPGQPTAPAVGAAPPPSGVTPLPPAAAAPATSSSSAAATATRSYGAGAFGLTLDGVNAGLLGAVEGGAAVAEVVVERVGPDNISKKHAAGVRYEELSFEVGFDSKPVLDWIASSWKGSFQRKSGSVLLGDYNYNVRSERQFTQALITGTTMPVLDASLGKAAGAIKVTIAPESVRETAASGKLQTTAKALSRWNPSSFRFEMGDLDATRVTRIESFTVGQKVFENPVGEQRGYEKQPNSLVFPDLKITISEAGAASWARWHEDFVVKGMNGDAEEKNGAIVFLDPTRTKELGRVNLFNCGIFRFGPERRERDLDRVVRVTADLYCERMELVTGAAGS